jgi:ABC-type Zn uptake system ZnuABC Zn-binding protein ZnuA
MIRRINTHPGGLLAALLLSLIAAACGGSGATATPAANLLVVATIPVLADFAGRVGGDGVEVRTLVPSTGDVHSFQSTPRDSVVIGEARLIVVNGGAVDDFLRAVIDAARSDGVVVVEATQGLIPADARTRDSHFWLDPLRAVTYVERIRDGLVSADPGKAERYRRNADVFAAELRALHEELIATLSGVPSERRVLVSFHDAFGHFGARYNFEVLAFVGGDGGNATPATVVEVIETVRTRGGNVIFAEPQLRRDVLERVATDAGITVGEIRSGTFDAAAPNYKEMMRANARSIVEHLGAGD